MEFAYLCASFIFNMYQTKFVTRAKERNSKLKMINKNKSQFIQQSARIDFKKKIPNSIILYLKYIFLQ